jgi:site-specific DNA recombinase
MKNATRQRRTATDTRTAIGYIRVSTTGQADEGVSLDEQRERITAYCRANGYQLLRIEQDAISGKRADNRPGLERALQGVCQAKGVLVVAKLDRLARSTRDAIEIADHIDNCGADLASIAEKIDTASAMGRFVFRLLASLGELEREQIAERTRAALQHKRSKGERVGRHIPIGYDLADDGVTLEANADEQAAINRMVQLRRDGMGYHRIAKRLTEEGHRPKRAKAWSAATVHRVLNRPEQRERVATS